MEMPTMSKKSNRVKKKGSTNGSKQIDERKDENDYDTKLSELKGAISSNGVNAIGGTRNMQKEKDV